MLYSIDLRKRVIKAVKSNMSKHKAAEVYNVCKQTIYNWLKLENEQGSLEPKTGFQKGHSHGIKDLAAFREFVDKHPDYTQEEMGEYFSVGSSTISRTLIKIGYTRKKRAKPTQSAQKKNVRNTLKK